MGLPRALQRGLPVGPPGWGPELETQSHQPRQLLHAYGSLTLSTPDRMSSRTWNSAAPSLGVLPVARQMALLSHPQHPLQAAPRLHCLLPSLLLWSQPLGLPPKQAPSCFRLDWPQPRPQRLSPQPSGTMAQLWAIAPCTSWMPLIIFSKIPERNEWEWERWGWGELDLGSVEQEAVLEGLGMFVFGLLRLASGNTGERRKGW